LLDFQRLKNREVESEREKSDRGNLPAQRTGDDRLQRRSPFQVYHAISLFVHCKTQREVDRLWETLSKGGEKGQCGWLKDKYGLSWQIIPSILGDLVGDKNPAKAERVFQAMMKMTKIDIRLLKQAYNKK
jgi:predicted 3-demethylubiquinone-9 3-methyltransferase (glyoxalase superfamily)